MEADLVKRAGVPFDTIPAAGVHGVGLRSLPGNLFRLGRGYFASRRLLRAFRPDVLFFTGGYVAVPVALAGKLPQPGVPRPRMVLYVPDIEPGLALKALARFADRIAVTVEDSKRYFPPAARERVTITGYPLRPELKTWEPEAARRALEVSGELPVLLVVGGSTGARTINRALFKNLAELLAEMQVVHLAGKLDWPEVEAAQKDLPAELASRYRAYPYLHSERMGAALTAADLVVGRAGASILGELPLFGLPAILAPYPYAWRYQQVNAEYLVSRGAAVILKDADLEARLLPEVRRLISDRSGLEEMRRSMRSLAQPQAADTLAALLEHMAATSAVPGGGASW
jgi:UDP-N-acetylglucosamine--N-acetylmuramyl-(pentapeptide) pyrophosphoryl-undecaprenol N-acetylglucosamine transferase